jgi:hypothetical protein
MKNISESYWMSNIDLQAQMAGENDRAYLAYRIYRDMGLERTRRKAYALYLKKKTTNHVISSRKVPELSPSYKSWIRDFAWEERAKDWDARILKQVESSLVIEDKQAYLNQLEKTRAQLDRTARIGLDVAELQLSIGRMEGSRLAKVAAIRPLKKVEILGLAETARICKVSIDTLAVARNELFCAMGVEDMQASLKKLVPTNEKHQTYQTHRDGRGGGVEAAGARDSVGGRGSAN